MSIISQEGNEMIFAPGQDLLSPMIEECKKELLAMVDQDPALMTWDLTAVAQVDALGLGLLVATYNSITQRGGQFRLVQVPESLKQLLQNMGLEYLESQ